MRVRWPCACRVMAGVWCGGESVSTSKNISVPVVRHLYPCGAGGCVSVTSKSGATDTAIIYSPPGTPTVYTIVLALVVWYVFKSIYSSFV